MFDDAENHLLTAHKRRDLHHCDEPLKEQQPADRLPPCSSKDFPLNNLRHVCLMRDEIWIVVFEGRCAFINSFNVFLFHGKPTTLDASQ